MEKVERTMEECKTCTDENKENDEHCRECIEKEKKKKINKTVSHLIERFNKISNTGIPPTIDTPDDGLDGPH